MADILEERRAELLQIYKVWQEELKHVAFSREKEKYSHPYYLYIPDDWFAHSTRMMIVGEEGAGKKHFDLPIEDAQLFNRDYLDSQLGKSSVYPLSASKFWERFRRIASEIPGVSLCWNNIDKIHISQRGNGKLSDSDRKLLHHTKTKILEEEIRILEPTHIVFLGWWGVSLEQECPAVFRWLYPKGLKDCSMWKGGALLTKEVDGISHTFTYHPGWRRKPKDYEDVVMQAIKAAVDNTAKGTS